MPWLRILRHASQLLRDLLGPLQELRINRLVVGQPLLCCSELVHQLLADVCLLHPAAIGLLSDATQRVGVRAGADGADCGLHRQFVFKL